MSIGVHIAFLDKDKKEIWKENANCFSSLGPKYRNCVISSKITPKFIAYHPARHVSNLVSWKDDVILQFYRDFVGSTDFFNKVIANLDSFVEDDGFFLPLNNKFWQIFATLTLLRYPIEFPTMIRSFVESNDWTWENFVKKHKRFSSYNGHSLYLSSDGYRYQSIAVKEFPHPSKLVGWNNATIKSADYNTYLNLTFAGKYTEEKNERQGSKAKTKRLD